MSDIPVQVVIAAFQDESKADAALRGLKDAQSQGLIKIRDAAVLKKDMDGKLHINDTKDYGFGIGALSGGVLGVVIGILMGPIALGLVAGALIGGLALKLHDGGFDDQKLRDFGANLKPGNSAIIAVIDHVWVAQVQAMMEQAGADAVTQAINADVAKQLDEGRDVIYTAIATGDQTTVGRAAVGADTLQMASVTTDGQTVVAQGLDANKDTAKATYLQASDAGVAGVTATMKMAGDAAATAIPTATAAAKSATDSATTAATDAAKSATDAATSAATTTTDAAKSAAQSATDAATSTANTAADAAKSATS